MGLWSQIAPHSTAIKQVKVSDRGHLGYISYQANDDDALGHVADNGELVTALLTKVADTPELEYVSAAEVSNIQTLKNGMRLQVDVEGKSCDYEADLVVLSDGALSSQAAQFGIAYENHNYGQHALIANVQHSKDHEGCAFERFTEQGPMALLPLKPLNGRFRSALVWTHSDDGIADGLNSSEEVFLNELQQRFGYRVGRFQRLGERVSFPLNLQFAKEQVRSSLVLMGNAAHYLHPVAGQGFNLTLRDCQALAEAIENALAASRPIGELSVLQSYIDSRQFDQKLTAKLSHSFIELFGSSKPIKQLGRTAGLLAMNKMPKLQSLFFQQMMGQGLIQRSSRKVSS